MMMKACAGFVLLAVVGQCAGFVKTTWEGLQANPDYSFRDYLTEFQKTYSGEELKHREAVFLENLRTIREHNAQRDVTWKMGLNEFTDWTAEEFKRRRTSHGVVRGEGLEAATVWTGTGGAIPTAVDWRTKNVVTKVKNQGACGSCWAFSATETLESHIAIKTGKLMELSEQQVVSCSPNPRECGGTGGCKGSTQPLAFNYTVTAGAVLESDYPYESGVGITWPCNKAKTAHPVAGITGYVKLPKNNYTALMDAVANVGPIAISAAAAPWQLYEGGIYSSKKCGYDMDHGIQLVGYGEEGDQMYWIVRNSWGPSWGEQGYIRIVRYGEGKEPCGLDKKPGDGDACKGDPTTPVEYCGECGILASSSYPTGGHLINSP